MENGILRRMLEPERAYAHNTESILEDVSAGGHYDQFVF